MKILRHNNKLITLLCVAFIVLMYSQISFGISTDTIDTLLHKHLKDSNVPAIGSTVIKDNEVIYTQTIRQEEQSQQFNSRSPMVIGSLSKSLTALAVMQLVEEDVIALDTPVKQYIPWFEVKDPEVSNTITVQHLLKQRTGLSRTHSIPTSDTDVTLEERIKKLDTMKAVAAPGETFHYLNDHYNILGLLIENVTDLSYGQYMEEHIFQPLGMDNTTADYEAIKALQLKGHTNILGFSKKYDQPIYRYDIPSGYIVSTLEDMTTYLNFLLSQNDQILSKDCIKEMYKTSTNSTYGMGWHIESIDGQQVISHSGAVGGFSSHMEFIPATNSGYVYLINKNHLIYNFVKSFKTLNHNLHQVITDQENFEFFPSIWVIRFVSLIIFLLTLQDVLVTKRLIDSTKNQNQWLKEAIKAFVLMLFLSIGLPFTLRRLLGLQIDWHVMLSYVPDFSILLIIAILVQVVRFITSVYRLITT